MESQEIREIVDNIDPSALLAAMPMVTVPTETDVEISNLRQEIVGLQSDARSMAQTIDNLRNTCQTLRERVSTAEDNHKEDMRTVTRFLHDVAERQEWCGEFEQFVAKANRELHVEIEPRTRKYDVTFPIYVTVTVEAAGGRDNVDVDHVTSAIRDVTYYADRNYDFHIGSAEVGDVDIEVSDND